MAEAETLTPEIEQGNDAVNKKQESLEEMLARHRKEKSKLQEKELSLKKAAAKGSKAEQKAKKKQVEDEITILSSELESKQAQELASLGYNNNSSNQKSNLDNLVKAIAGVSVSTPQTESSKQSKSAKRRGKRVQEEIARELRIQEEQNNLISDKMVENENLGKKLEPLGLKINEIKPDGHCLYRAVENQLCVHNKGISPYNYQELRELTSDYMKKNSNDFIPFFLSEGKIDLDEKLDPIESFEKYCEEIKSTPIWGGQLELGALSHVLKKHIVVYSGFSSNVEMGKEYKGENANSDNNNNNNNNDDNNKYNNNNNNWSVLLSYHKHAFGLGEHYNSVVSIGE